MSEEIDVRGPLFPHELASVSFGVLLNRCRRYLTRQRIVLWGQSFDLHETTGLEEAVTWLAEQITAVLRDAAS